jgi:uncharacterized protein
MSDSKSEDKPKHNSEHESEFEPNYEQALALKPLPIRFDPEKFADHERKLEGPVATKGMLRLRENVLAANQNVDAKLEFSKGYYGYPLVSGEVKAQVVMRCERCLGEVDIELNPTFSVLVKPEEDVIPHKEAENDDDEPDFHEYDGKSLVLSDLLEEELLLVLPLVPKHEDISLCDQDMVAWLAANDTDDEAQKTRSERAESPFAILKKS